MTDPLDFTGKTVLVIGGSSGIGNGIARGLCGAWSSGDRHRNAAR